MALAPRSIPLLLVDDDPLIHQSMRLILADVWKFQSALRVSDISWETFFPVVLVDMHLDKNSKKPEGLDVIRKIASLHPQAEIVAISGDLDQTLMENCLRAGAQRFLAKPLQADEVNLVLGKIAAWHELRSFSSTQNKVSWIGESEASKTILRTIASLKGETSPVLIEGESGVGKEVVATLLNLQEGSRPFIAVNAGAITENLFESELFGHIKGAFTGADQNKIGLCEAANGGDLFLDEIEAIPLSQQVKLLRFLESGEIRKVGGKEFQKVQTRVICASNRSIKKMVEAGEFREDLYHRLNAHQVSIPPLRSRTADIAPLAKFFLSNVRPLRNKSFNEDGITALTKYSWSGNTRELKRICEQLSLVTPLPVIREEDVLRLLKFDLLPQLNSQEIDLDKGLDTLTSEFEAQILKSALLKFPDIEEAAKALKVSRSTMYKKIKDHQLDVGSL